jgi:hypothetical protein
MPLWGTEDTLEGKPKIHGRSLLDATQTPGELDPRTGIYATTAGWVQGGAGRTGKNLMPEVLVAIRGLSTRSSAAEGFGGTAMAQANITSFNWNISTWSRAAGGTLSVTANFNEAVDVTGTPRLTVVNDSRTNHTLSYASGTGSNRLTFTLVIGAAAGAIHATDVLSVGANAMAHNGGSTIVDDVGAGNSVITNSAGIGAATGTITAVA